jgi:cytoskeletal protein RodZ
MGVRPTQEHYMSFDLHTVEVPDGFLTSQPDRILIGNLPNQANAAGGSAGAAVTVPFTGLHLPANYSVQAEASQACWLSVTNKTQTGFNVVLTPTSGTATIAAGTIDVTVIA